MPKFLREILKSRLKLEKGTRLTSFLFLGVSILIAGAILFAANVYFNIDTGEVIMEHIQRVTNVIRATGGLIVGGAANQNPDVGYVFQVVGQAKLATTSLVGYLEAIHPSEAPLRVATSSGGYYVGFRAPANLAQTTIYTLPTNYPAEAGYLLQSDSSGNLSWTSPAAAGLGDITAVGDVASGEAFTPSGSGTTLWFHSGTNLGALTIATLSANATYTLPAVSGTYYFPLTSGAMTAGQVLLATANYTLGGDANLTFDTSSRTLTIGSSGNQGVLRIFSNNANYLAFAPTSSLGSSATYYWPAYPPGANYVLTSDASGNLSWQTVSGVGAVTGAGAAGYVAYWTGSNSLGYDTAFAWDATNNILTIGGTIIANTFKGSATTTITSDASYGILLDPGTGRILLGAGDWIETAQGFTIGKPNTQILKEMVPIFGFDLPVYTATSGTVKISRDIVSYPLGACEAGTQRVHKLVIRYGSAATTSWAIATSTGNVSTFSVPPSGSTTTGSVYTVSVTIPTPAGACTGWTQGTDTADWWVTVSPGGNPIMIYQIFLAGYDQVL